MTIIIIPPGASGPGMLHAMDTMERIFGRYWMLAWVACGLVGFAGMGLFAYLCVPGLMIVRDGLELLLILMMLALCVIGGPFAVPMGPIFIIFWKSMDLLMRWHF